MRLFVCLFTMKKNSIPLEYDLGCKRSCLIWSRLGVFYTSTSSVLLMGSDLGSVCIYVEQWKCVFHDTYVEKIAELHDNF